MSLTEGPIGADDRLAIVSEHDEGGVVFGDGIESDCVDWLGRPSHGWSAERKTGVLTYT